MKVVIVDDEFASLELIAELINIFFQNTVKVVGKAQNIADAKRIIENTKPDLIFLDIEMPGGSGFELLRSMANKDLAVIFITGYHHYALDSFKFNTLDYILKPISPSEFKKGVEKALQRQKPAISTTALLEIISAQKDKATKILLPTLNGFDFYTIANIAYCKADDKYTWVFDGENQGSLISKSIREFEELLRNYDFLRVHKTFLVNKDFVVRFNKNDNSLLLTNDITVPISSRKKDEFLEWILTETT